MARIPISFLLNILAGIFVLFNHYAASETGDVALNKVTGAVGQFNTLFQDSAIALQQGYTSLYDSLLCGSAVDSVLPQSVAAYIKRSCCDGQDLKGSDEASESRRPHGGYGSSDFAFAHHRLPLEPRFPRWQTSVVLGSSSHISRTVWGWSSAVTVLLVRTCASYCWFKAPLRMTGVLIVAYSVLSALSYLMGASVALQFVSQAGLVDFVSCMEWEARRHVFDVGAMAMEQAYGVVRRRKRGDA